MNYTDQDCRGFRWHLGARILVGRLTVPDGGGCVLTSADTVGLSGRALETSRSVVERKRLCGPVRPPR
jgi:hypothetical protein